VPIKATRQARYNGRRRHPARSSTSTKEEFDETQQGSIENFSHDVEGGSLGHLNDFWLSQSTSQLSDDAYNTNHDDKNRIATQRQKTSHMARECPTEKISWSITSVNLEHPNLYGREPRMSLEHAVTKRPGKHSCFWKSMGQCVVGFQFILSQNTPLLSCYFNPSLQEPLVTMTTRPSRKAPSSLLSATKASSARTRSSSRLKARTTGVDKDTSRLEMDVHVNDAPTNGNNGMSGNKYTARAVAAVTTKSDGDLTGAAKSSTMNFGKDSGSDTGAKEAEDAGAVAANSNPVPKNIPPTNVAPIAASTAAAVAVGGDATTTPSTDSTVHPTVEEASPGNTEGTPSTEVNPATSSKKLFAEVAGTDAPAFTTPTTAAVAIGTALESNGPTDTSPSPKNLYSIFSKTPSKSLALTGLGKTRVATTKSHDSAGVSTPSSTKTTTVATTACTDADASVAPPQPPAEEATGTSSVIDAMPPIVNLGTNSKYDTPQSVKVSSVIDASKPTSVMDGTPSAGLASADEATGTPSVIDLCEYYGHLHIKV